MDIYSFRLLAIILILALSTLWLFMHFRNKDDKDVKPSMRNRGMDGHSMGPLFLDEEGLEKLKEPEPEPEVAEAPTAGHDDEEEDAGRPSGLGLLKNLAKKTKSAPKKPAKGQSPSKRPAEDIQIICLQLNARRSDGFHGHSLLSMFAKHELVFGKMDVFHKQVNMGGQDKTSFSVINGEAPGTLIPEEIQDRSTQRIMFYIALNECHSPMKSFEEMLEIAKSFAVALDGMLCDDQGCDLSEQNIEYHWDLVREFIIRNRLKPAAKH